MPTLSSPAFPCELPAPPAIQIVVARDRTALSNATGGFFDVLRFDLVVVHPDGTSSAPFPYDVGTRRALDAVVIAAHFSTGGVRHVYLRSAVRPPCALRPSPPPHDGTLWELPAGLVEPDETPPCAAARELGEELGFHVEATSLIELGPWTFPAPAIIGERHLFFAVEVEPSTQSRPTEDGSELEKGAAILAIPLMEALEHCRRGAIQDAKTELALRRLAEAL